MTRVFRDEDGDLVERGIDGSLIPVDEPEPPAPNFTPDTLCLEHGEPPLAQHAETCSACWSEIKAGDRPRSHLGRVWNPTDEGN